MPIPVSRTDFVLIGRRFLSENIVAEIDRLLPVASSDLPHLERRGYGAEHLEQLKSFRSQLTAESADRRKHRGDKKGVRVVEVEAIRKGKLLLQSGIAYATTALANRVAPPAESEDSTREVVERTVAQIDALKGKIGNDSARLRSRLTVLTSVLALRELSPATPTERKNRAEFVARVEAAIEGLPNIAETKKLLQSEAKDKTDDLDEIDGRAYFNMKLLTRTGRAWWMENGNPKRAGLYQLTSLHEAAVSRPELAPVPGPGNTPVTPVPVTP